MAEKEIGKVSDYFDHVGVIAFKLTSPLKLGDTIKVKGNDFEFQQIVESMQINRKPIKSAKKGDEVGIKVNEKAKRGSKVFKVG